MDKQPRDIYQEVTDKIVTAIEAGTMPWLRPWRDGKSTGIAMPYNAATGRPYNGMNVLILGMSPYSDYGWLTYKQASELGGNVRKGEKGTLVIFWKFLRVEDRDTKEQKTIPMVRGYTVFNVSQCEGLDEKKLKRPAAPVIGDTDINAVAQRVHANVQHGGNRAYYTPSGDYIQIPSVADFKSVNDYQGTLAHELVHWTSHTDRCNRDLSGRFGSDAYAFEELVAEIGSAFVCAQTGISLDGLQHPAYVANWLRVLKNDKRAIFTASSKAKTAAEFLLADTAEEDEDLDLAA